ncbi:MAG: hypothetical protein IH865_10170 [Chloroflexi bacterium]|nr:hypothetical protein [Chloroflexota bacterium]
MKRILLVVAIAVVGLAGLSSLPRSGEAGNLAYWDDLAPGCFDVTGDGYVDLANDIFGVIMKYQTEPGDADYSLLYDVSGGGIVDLTNDILGTILAYDTYCTDIDTQVILATAGMMRYQDCDAAVADGYGPNSGGVYVPNMGIHISKVANIQLPFYDGSDENLALAPEDQQHQLTNPFGLVCTEKQGGQAGRPDQLIGAWYIVPTGPTGSIYGVSCPCQPNDVQPVGFGQTNIDEDNLSESGDPDNECVGFCNSGWHIHWNLCVGNGFLIELGAGFPNAGAHCTSKGGFVLINPYGWMLHFYNFIPNPESRFFKWNSNPDLQQYMPPLQ